MWHIIRNCGYLYTELVEESRLAQHHEDSEGNWRVMDFQTAILKISGGKLASNLRP